MCVIRPPAAAWACCSCSSPAPRERTSSPPPAAAGSSTRRPSSELTDRRLLRARLAAGRPHGNGRHTAGRRVRRRRNPPRSGRLHDHRRRRPVLRPRLPRRRLRADRPSRSATARHHRPRIEQIQFTPDQLPALTTRALAEAAADRIQPIIGQTFPLDQAADAHTAIENRSATGKTLPLTKDVHPLGHA